MGFSAIDDQWDSELCPYTGRVLPRMIHASLVVGAKSCDARFYDWVHRRRSPVRLYRGELQQSILVCGRAGSGKTNLAYIIIQGLLEEGIPFASRCGEIFGVAVRVRRT